MSTSECAALKGDRGPEGARGAGNSLPVGDSLMSEEGNDAASEPALATRGRLSLLLAGPLARLEACAEGARGGERSSPA